jgi:hypothetical protein
VAVKNLAEEGFNVVGFERSPFVGGLWHFSEEDRTSVLPSETAMPLFSVSLIRTPANRHR